MVKRKVGALEKIDADLQVLADQAHPCAARLTLIHRSNLQYKIKRDPTYAQAFVHAPLSDTYTYTVRTEKTFGTSIANMSTREKYFYKHRPLRLTTVLSRFGT